MDAKEVAHQNDLIAIHSERARLVIEGRLRSAVTSGLKLDAKPNPGAAMTYAELAATFPATEEGDAAWRRSMATHLKFNADIACA